MQGPLHVAFERVLGTRTAQSRERQFPKPLLSQRDCAITAGAGGDGEMWEPREARGGHYGAVVDACWAVGGAVLLTVSADQTARLTARCDGRWCEIARPQVRAARGPAWSFQGIAVNMQSLAPSCMTLLLSRSAWLQAYLTLWHSM